jgi:hypothetical protein
MDFTGVVGGIFPPYISYIDEVISLSVNEFVYS